ncbi:MAG: RNA methyltransferase, partial [Deltaproteobacteria bacterium]|nr:RNA methyltransferase [Deltaproteobacteria bacterium]
PSGHHQRLYARCPPELFTRIAYRAHTPNAIAILRARPHTLDALTAALRATRGPELLLILEGIEKPGNLGALLRTADALGVSGVVLCDCPCDLYHPNALRNSLGGAFSVPTATCTRAEALPWLKARGVQLIITHLEGARPPYALDLRGPTALVLGAEDKGVTPEWAAAADHLARIPMSGVVDSLNVSAAAAMILYEATRQRALSPP